MGKALVDAGVFTQATWDSKISSLTDGTRLTDACAKKIKGNGLSPGPGDDPLADEKFVAEVLRVCTDMTETERGATLTEMHRVRSEIEARSERAWVGRLDVPWSGEAKITRYKIEPKWPDISMDATCVG